jgi:4-amino-4-deoxy-L-arabinose transferase-like glycosyltransferase
MKKHFSFQLSNFLELFLVTFLPMMLSYLLMQGMGIGWDEPNYILGGIKYLEWFKTLSLHSFSHTAITESWKINHEHPPLAKLGFGFFYFLLHKQTGLLDSSRFFNCFLYGLFNLGLFLFLSSCYSVTRARIIILILQCFPRFLIYTHIAMLDFPLCFFWVGLILTYFLSQKSHLFLGISVILYGALQLTKFNGVFAIIPVFLWSLFRYQELVQTIRKITLIVVCSLILFLAGWPWLYSDTALRWKQYLLNKTGRLDSSKIISLSNKKTDVLPSKIPVYYLGHLYDKKNVPPPWHYAPVMFLTSIPAGILLFFFLGIYSVLKNRKKDPFGFFSLINIFFLLSIMMLPWIPKYGGIRFLLPLYPFTAVLTAEGMVYLFSFFPLLNDQFKMIMISLFLLCNFLPVLKYKDSLSNYYNAFTGGLKGAYHLGLGLNDTEMSLSPEVIEYINTFCPKNGKIAITPNSPYVRQLYQNLGIFRSDLVVMENPMKADWIILFSSVEFFDEPLKVLFYTQRPIYKKELSGVPLCQIYKRPDNINNYLMTEKPRE